jgi:2-keto-4-pentenoate hydratase/2-oxohepta-3-ene-1,7-dioic acid hydratase in catechol pathway
VANATAPEDAPGTSRIVPLSRLSPLLHRAGAALSSTGSVLSLLEHWPENLSVLTRLYTDAYPQVMRLSTPEAQARIHAPIPVPRQIFCTVANYRSQVTEAIMDAGAPPHTDGMDADQRRSYAKKAIEARLASLPYVCFKLPSTVIGSADSLELPRQSQCVDWEIELAVIIGQRCRNVPREQAMAQIAGYMLVNDITARDLVRRTDLPNLGTDWLQSKNAPGFLPTGPYLVPACFIADPYAVRLSLSLNGEIMQNELVADMMFDIAMQIEYVSSYAQLLPGDIICTGTPGGCGIHHGRFLQRGDILEGYAPGFGTQRVICV